MGCQPETQGANCNQMTPLPLSFQGYISFVNSITLCSLMTKRTQNQRIFLFAICKFFFLLQARFHFHLKPPSILTEALGHPVLSRCILHLNRMDLTARITVMYCDARKLFIDAYVSQSLNFSKGRRQVNARLLHSKK